MCIRDSPIASVDCMQSTEVAECNSCYSNSHYFHADKFSVPYSFKLITVFCVSLCVFNSSCTNLQAYKSVKTNGSVSVSWWSRQCQLWQLTSHCSWLTSVHSVHYRSLSTRRQLLSHCSPLSLCNIKINTSITEQHLINIIIVNTSRMAHRHWIYSH